MDDTVKLSLFLIMGISLRSTAPFALSENCSDFISPIMKKTLYSCVVFGIMEVSNKIRRLT